MEPQLAPRHLIGRICKHGGVDLTEDQLKSLTRFTDLVLSWNSKINLLSRTDAGNIWTSHVLHSLSPLFALEIPKDLTLLDLGSGGGFPGIPLAIARRDLTITLLDSIKKKTTALESMIGDLALGNLSVISGRAEGLKEKSARFNIVFARAVSSLTDLIKWSKPLVVGKKEVNHVIRAKEGDRLFSIPCLIAMKGGDLEAEMRTARIKTGNQRITTLDLRFGETTALENKKLVIVEFET